MKYYLSICACVRNEGRYIDDWIWYHRRLGVQHFYLFENESTDNTWKIINSMPGAIVSRQQVVGKHMQKTFYGRLLNTCKHETVWAAFIDVDEYIVPHKTNNLKEFLKPFEPHPAVCIHWRLFGSNGHLYYTPKPVVERFTRRQADVHPRVKSIVRPKEVHVFGVHRFKCLKKRSVDEYGNQMPHLTKEHVNRTCDLIQINHYATKSQEECFERRSQRQVNSVEPKDPELFCVNRDYNDVEDLRALELFQP